MRQLRHKRNLRADRGTIDIRHTGDAGQINLGGPAASDAIDAHADVIKVAALGNNGVLTIGNGVLSADTTLKLYSPGSNGTVNFVANVTLGGASTKIIAGNTVNIFNGVVVTVGGSHPASVYTNNANYSGFGGMARAPVLLAERGQTILRRLVMLRRSTLLAVNQFGRPEW